MAAFLEPPGYMAVKDFGVGQPARRRPALVFQVLAKQGLNLFHELVIAGAGVTNNLVQQLMGIKEVAGCLFKLALEPVHLTQAGQIKVEQGGLVAGVLGQFPLIVGAGGH